MNQKEKYEPNKTKNGKTAETRWRSDQRESHSFMLRRLNDYFSRRRPNRPGTSPTPPHWRQPIAAQRRPTSSLPLSVLEHAGFSFHQPGAAPGDRAHVFGWRTRFQKSSRRKHRSGGWSIRGRISK